MDVRLRLALPDRGAIVLDVPGGAQGDRGVEPVVDRPVEDRHGSVKSCDWDPPDDAWDGNDTRVLDGWYV